MIARNIRHMRLGLYKPVVLAVPIDPATLFTGGVKGAYWEPGRSTYSGGTLSDLSGHGHSMLQATAGKRPALTSGPPHYLTFDGVDDTLESTTLSNLISANALELHMAVRIITNPSLGSVVYQNPGMGADADGYMGIFTRKVIGQSNVSGYHWDTAADSLDQYAPIDTDFVVGIWHEGGDLFMQINNDTPLMVASGDIGALTGAFKFGQGNVSYGFANFRLYGAVIRGSTYTSGQRASVRQYLANLAGIDMAADFPDAPPLFDPATLLTTGDKGGYWVPGLSGYSGGTLQDLSSLNRDLSQGTAANRPTGTDNYLLFDGVNDQLTYAPVGDILLGTQFDVITAWRALAIDENEANTYGNQCVFADSGANIGIWVANAGSGRLARIMGYGWDGADDHLDFNTVDGVTVGTNKTYVGHLRYDGTNLKFRVNNETELSMAHGTNSLSISFHIGRHGNSSISPLNMRWYGAFVRSNTLLSADDLFEVRKFFGDWAGVNITA